MEDVEPQGAIPIEQFQPADSSTPETEAPPPGSIPIEEFQGENAPTPGPDLSKYETPYQQFTTVTENAAQGIAGPLATLAETKVFGVSPEDIKNRAKANPGEAIAGQLGGFGLGMFMGASEARAGTAIAEAFTPAASGILGKIGAKALNNAIQAGFFQVNNELTKSLLGESDPGHAVSSAMANTGAAFLFGGVLGAGIGAAGEAVGSGLQKVGAQKWAGDFLHGIGASTVVSEPELLLAMKNQEMSSAMKQGAKLGLFLHSQATEHALGAIAGALMPSEDNSTSKRLMHAGLGYLAGPYIVKGASAVLYKLIANQTPEGMDKAVSYIGTALKGDSQINKAIGNVFDYSGSKVIDFADPAKHIERVRDFIENGGVDNQLLNTPLSNEPAEAFAKGGEVKNNPPADMNGIQAHFPEQNVMLNAAKMRVSNYLSSKSPKKNATKLPFDSNTRNPDQERDYEHALRLSVRPLEILNDVKRGNLTPKKVAAFTAMYPEIYNHLSKQMTKKITDIQFKDEEKPPYHLRQSLSLFLGANLDSTMMPQNIAAAQSTFIMKKQQQAQQVKSKMSGKAGENAMTPEQARTKALNKT